MDPVDLDSAHYYLGRARDRVAGIRLALDDMVRPGLRHDLEVVERHFAATLRRLGEAHAALRQAGREGGATAWLVSHDRAAETDPLLVYVLNAPDGGPDETLLTWPRAIQEFDMRVVNDKAIRFNDRGELMHYIFRCGSDAELFQKVAAGVMPSVRRLRKAGAELLVRYDELALRPYAARQGLAVLPPVTHRGRPLGGTAEAALEACLGFFAAETDALTRLLPPPPP